MRLRQLNKNYVSAQKELEQLMEEHRILKDIYNKSEVSDEAKALIEKKQRRIEQLEQQIEQYQIDLNTLTYSEREKLLKETGIVVYFMEKITITPNWKIPRPEKWKQLSDVYNQYMPLVSAYINKTGLSRQEYLTCILSHIGLSSGDIATLLGTHISRISNAKRSACKKLFNDEASGLLRKRFIDIECSINVKTFSLD